eukprot:CAMPEP_0182504760 /NCGR_PEP_ID=MMETSP1321-20130603/17814_1 /TAXON_ID=91990 /ORGANISM="Bolidomonas sp., Strain RCC1657" /LENGTH=72 /DNA_ID=CAMNT_0024710171 /DNA_START=167 /DNA_END=382 /DNA_ORIENTATION=+
MACDTARSQAIMVSALVLAAAPSSAATLGSAPDTAAGRTIPPGRVIWFMMEVVSSSITGGSSTCFNSLASAS